MPQVREAVRTVDRDLPIFQAQTLSEGLAEQRWPFRVFGSMFAIFAVIALVLSSVGIYAVTAIPSPSAPRRSGSAWRSAPNPVRWCGW